MTIVTNRFPDRKPGDLDEEMAWRAKALAKARRFRVDPSDVREVIAGPNMNPHKAAEACGVTLKQVRRWMDGSSAIPLSAYRLLRILVERDLGVIAREWTGWQLWGDYLHTPEGVIIKQGDYYAVPYLQAAAADREKKLQTDYRRLSRLFAAHRSRRAAAPIKQEPKQLTFLTPVPVKAPHWVERRQNARAQRLPEHYASPIRISPAPAGSVISIQDRRSLRSLIPRAAGPGV